MSRVYVYAGPGRYSLIRGHLRDWLHAHGVPAMWAPADKGWWVREERMPDLVAQLEHDGYTVRPKGVPRDLLRH